MNVSPFLRFTVLSGVGWLIDAAILIVLSGQFSVGPFTANVLSSSVAASLVFLVSRIHIHQGNGSFVFARLAFYLLYNTAMITIFSFAIVFVINVIDSSAILGISGDLRTLLAKIIITPPQLLSNFFVSRFVARYTSFGFGPQP